MTYPKPRIRRPKFYPRDKFGQIDKRSIQYKRPLTFRKILKYYAKLFRYRRLGRARVVLSFFKIYLRKYYMFYRKTRRRYLPRVTIKNTLFKSLIRWRNSWSRKIARINTRRYRMKPEEFRRIYLRAKRSRHLELVRQQHYYGFRSLKLFLTFFKKFEMGYSSSRFGIGLEGLIVHLLYRCNLVSTVRGAYLLVRLKAIQVNKTVVHTPHKCLRVGDTFGVLPRYTNAVFKAFKKMLKRRLLRINTPNYLEYNYRLMFFLVWRRPTRSERLFLHHAPYRRAITIKSASL